MTTLSKIRTRALLGAAALALPLAAANAAETFPQLVVTVVPPNCKSDWVGAPMPSGYPGDPWWNAWTLWSENAAKAHGPTWGSWELAVHKQTLCDDAWLKQHCTLWALPCRDPKTVELPAVGTVTAIGPTLPRVRAK